MIFYITILIILISIGYYNYFNNDNNIINDINNDKVETLKEIIDRIKFDINIPNNEIIIPNFINKLSKIESINKFKNIINKKWKSKESTSKFILKRNPVKFIDSIAKSWNAINWDFWNLSISWPLLQGLFSLQIDNNISNDNDYNNNVFIIENEIDIGGMIKINTLNNDNLKKKFIDEIMFADFLYDLNSIKDQYFYSTNYRVMEGIAKLQNDTTWSDFIITEIIIAKSKLKIKQPAPQIWMLYPGTALQIRYSEYHTMRIQIHGKTRYTLFSPEQIKNLYLYPSIHLSYSQSQVNLYNSIQQLNNFPKFQKEIIFNSTILSPGEILYIPPYWSVHTESLDVLSVGIDVLSFSHEQLILKEAFMMGLPFKNDTNQNERIVYSQVYLMHIFSRIPGFKSPKIYAEKLYTSRYKSLYPENGIFLQKSKFQCLRDEPKLHHAIVQSLDRDRVINAANFITDALIDPVISKSIKWLWLDNYIEQLARWAMNDPDLAVVFIRECFQFDKKLQVIEEVEGGSSIKIND